MAEVPKSTSRKEWRKLMKKIRRKRIRQKLAQVRDTEAAESEARKLADPNYVEYLLEKEQLEQQILQRQEERSRYEHALWLDREKQAQAGFEEKRKRLLEEQREETEKRGRIRKEFEELERKAKEAKAEKERILEEFRKKQQEREQMFAEYLVGIDDHVLKLREISHSRVDRDACAFFGKVGACRYGARCSSDHPTPGLSELLLMSNFFAHPALDHQQHPEYGLDSSIEFDDDELYRCYTEFFLDIIEEFESFGSIIGIFACRNYEPHLRGNVYVQYKNLRDAAKAYYRMNGRFYASKQLRVEFRSPIIWTSAVCGKLNEMSRCQKGKSCNYLHLLVNPIAKYRYNHFKELQSIRQSQRQSQRSQPLERSWDDIEIPAKQQTNWRWSETPEVELPPHNSRSSSRSDATSRHRNSMKRSQSRDSSSRSQRSSSKRRNRSRSRSRHRSRERQKEKRSKPSRSRSSDRRKDNISKRKKSRSRSRESRTKDKRKSKIRSDSRKSAK